MTIEELVAYIQEEVATEEKRRGLPSLVEMRAAACRSIGTSQCAAICLSNLTPYGHGGCPEAHRVWTLEAIRREQARRPNGPLSEYTVA